MSLLDEIRETNKLLQEYIKEQECRKKDDKQALNAIRLIAEYCDTHNCGACAIDRYCEALEFPNEMPIMHLIEEIEDVIS